MPTIKRPKQVSEMSDEELQKYKVPSAESISYKRDPVIGQQDMLSTSTVKPLTSSSISGISMPPAAELEEELPTLVPRGTIRKKKAVEDDKSAVPPQKIVGTN